MSEQERIREVMKLVERYGEECARVEYLSNADSLSAMHELEKQVALETVAEALASLPSNPEHDTYGAPPVGALTSAAEQFVAWHKDGSDALTSGMLDYFAEIFGEALAAAPAPAVMDCEDCNGTGEVGDEIYQGEFQPPERERCTSCDGSGRWRVTPAPSEAVKGVSPCKRCGGSGVVDDGEFDCSEGGIPYENGPIKCVKDCPACKGAVKGVSTAEPRRVYADLCIPGAPYAAAMSEGSTVQMIDPPDFGEMPMGITNLMNRKQLWAYANLCGYRAALAAPSHPPATTGNCDICHGDPERCDVHDCGDAHRPPATPAVAVQAEPAAVLKGRAAIIDAWNNLHHGTRTLPSMDALFRAVSACEDAAHPKPAAPATADEAVSELPPLPEADWVLKGSAKDRDGYTAAQMRDYAILALRSGASAQPAGGAK